MSCADTSSFAPSRRWLLGASGVLAAWSFAPRQASANARDPRFLTLVLRGALDGLSAVPPIGDPAYAGLRGDIALTIGGERAALPLDGFFYLHPAMAKLHGLYQAGEALFVHATATGYRERSHFDGQDVLESGVTQAGYHDNGWLNRAMMAMETGERVRGRQIIGLGPMVPLVARGRAPVLSWSPQVMPPVSEDTTERLMELYGKTDAPLAEAFARRRMVDAMVKGGERNKPKGGAAAYVVEASTGAAKLLAKADGPRVAAMAFDGFDTHASEGAAKGQLANRLSALDDGLFAMKEALGDAWNETVIAIITEFGRTAKVNGTDGTDHGTATVMMLVGGAVKGRRVIADWPGLRPAELYEGRDLKPTRDLRAVLKGVLRDHLQVPARALEVSVFPASLSAPPMDGLVRT